MQFWSKEFFDEAVARLGQDEKMKSAVKGISTSILAVCADRSPSFLIGVKDGSITVREAPSAESAEFRFTAPLEEWANIIQNGLKIQSEVVKGRVKFGGSLPKMLLYLSRVARMEGEILSRMREMNPEF